RERRRSPRAVVRALNDVGDLVRDQLVDAAVALPVRAGTAVGDVAVVVARVLIAGRMPTGVPALVEDRVQQRIRSELPERLLGVPPGLVKVGQQPARGILVHVRIEVDRDVAGRPSQAEQLVVLEPMLPPRRRRTAVHAPILSQPYRRTRDHVRAQPARGLATGGEQPSATCYPWM